MSTTDYLSALNYGTSTGGAAGSAESASTLGAARLDRQVPPSQYQISGLQITRLVEFALAVSSDLKGGTRVRVRKQSSNPFGASESGFYISQAGTGYVVVDGVATAIGAGGGSGDMVLADVQTVTGEKTFNSGKLVADAPTLSGTIAGTYTIGGTPTLGANMETGSTYLTSTTEMRVRSSAADGASAVAHAVDTTTAWSTTGAKLQSWRTNTAEAASLIRNGTYWAFMIPSATSGGYFFNTANLDGLLYQSGTVSVRTSAATYWNFTGATFISSDGAGQVGTVADRLLGVRAYSYDTKMGAQLTAAASITPTAGFHHVTGATTIDTIAVTNLAGNPTLVLVADGGTITWSAAGNILSAGTIAQDKAQWFIYDLASTKWVPQQ